MGYDEALARVPLAAREKIKERLLWEEGIGKIPSRRGQEEVRLAIRRAIEIQNNIVAGGDLCLPPMVRSLVTKLGLPEEGVRSQYQDLLLARLEEKKNGWRYKVGKLNATWRIGRAQRKYERLTDIQKGGDGKVLALRRDTERKLKGLQMRVNSASNLVALAPKKKEEIIQGINRDREVALRTSVMVSRGIEVSGGVVGDVLGAAWVTAVRLARQAGVATGLLIDLLIKVMLRK